MHSPTHRASCTSWVPGENGNDAGPDQPGAMTSLGRIGQAEAACRALIDAGRPGDRLPGEAELASMIGTSRTTVREALSRLWLAGMVTRRWGIGTFIADRTAAPTGSIYVGLDPVGSLPQRLRNAGHSVEVSHFATEPASWPAWFSGGDRLGEATLVERCMSIDGAPAIVLHDYLPTAIRGIPLPDPQQLKDADHDLPTMFRTVGLRIVKEVATLHGHIATEAIAQQLNLADGSPILLTRQRSVAEFGDAVACAATFYRTDLFTNTIVRTVSE